MKKLWDKIKDAVYISVAVSVIGASATSIISNFSLKKDVTEIKTDMVTKDLMREYYEANRLWLMFAADSTASEEEKLYWRERVHNVLTE